MLSYMKSFHTNNLQVDLGITIKETHTLKVADNAEALARRLNLAEHDVLLAKIIGLFHDVGRFKQFSVYKTFNDAASENHALLGLKILKEKRLLVQLPEDERQLIEFAIKNHNTKAIEKTDSKRRLLFAKIIRDADKLDIFRVLRPYLTFDDKEPCSDFFIKQFQDGGQCDYTMIRTQNDRKLVRLLWLYDVNFAWTLGKITEQGYVNEIISALPQTENMQKGFGLLKKYIEKKLQQRDAV